MRFVLYCCGYVMVDFIHILQGYFAGTETITGFRHLPTHCEQYRNSYFPRTIPELNQLLEPTVSADTTA